MDFPICPSCNQSVIDDDATECPFCGASMKAKPGTKPAPAAAKTPAGSPAAANPTAASPKPIPGKPGAGKPGPADDFPFELELTAGKAAIQSMPNPTKQRSLKVVCPMCDTPGYLPANAAGQDVRCANPKCVMPVFTAPAPKKVEAPPPPPPPKPSRLPFLITTTLVLGATIGGGLYFINSQPSGSSVGRNQLSEEDKALMMGTSKASAKKPDKTSTKSEKTETASKDEKVEATANSAGIDKQKMIQDALKQMKESSLENSSQRSKPYCRQLAAEASILTGDAAAMKDHLNQLMKVNHELSYYAITPWLEQFWIQTAVNDKKAAAKALELAMGEVPKIQQKTGRTRLELAGRLAAALVAADRMPDALKLLEDFRASDDDAQLAAHLQIATDGQILPLKDDDSVLPWKYPLAVAVTGSLFHRGQLELSGKWAAAQTNDEAKSECLAYWAEVIAQRNAAAGAADAAGAIESSLSGLSPALAARVWVRAGFGRMRAGDEAGATAAMKLAQARLSEIPKPAECKMPTVKATENFKVPDVRPLLQSATATGELASLQAQFAATKPDAENSLDAALTFIDAMGPTLSLAQHQQEEISRMGTPGLMKYLKDELKLRNDDQARTAASKYRSALDAISKAAQQRFDLSTLLLSRLRGAGLGLNSKVWIIVNARTTTEDVNQRDNYFATGLPGELREGLKGTDEEQAILGAWRQMSPGSEPPPPVSVEFNRRLETNPSAAAEYLQKAESKSNRREEIALLATSRLTLENKLVTVFAFVGRLADRTDKENCYRLAASLATQKGLAQDVWKQVSKVTEQTEKVALCRGLIGGLLAGVPETAAKK